jgi:hypothetical protein
MGLAISVGTLADFNKLDTEGADWIREKIAVVNRILQENGLPAFTEPETLTARRGPSETSFPYSFLHYLRRVYAYVREGMPLTSAQNGISAEDKELVMETSMMLESHLLCHSDAEGFYVPVDFADPLFDDKVPGAILGSSYALMRELAFVAPALQIDMKDGAPTDTALQRLRDIKDESTPYWREQIVWLTLYESARFSIAHETMIVFQ